LIVFRFDELPFNEFKKIVESQDAVKMTVLLEFLFDIEKLTKYVKAEWELIYDIFYIDTTIIEGLEKKLP